MPEKKDIKPCERCGSNRWRTKFKEGGVRKEVACRECRKQKFISVRRLVPVENLATAIAPAAV